MDTLQQMVYAATSDFKHNDLEMKPTTFNQIIYSAEQLECICQALFQARDGAQLVRLFSEHSNCDLLRAGSPWYSQSVLVAYIYALYHSEQYERLFDIIGSTHFDEHHYKDLQDIWYNAHYKENEKKRGKELGPVEKYRLRRKFPPPRSIWDGQETVYSFKENSRKYLKQFYKENPYPSAEQKKQISEMTGLELMQIANWFKNRRQRDKTSKNIPYRNDFHHNLHHYGLSI